MTHAIACLQVALETAEHNEPICRAEGRTEHADGLLLKAAEYRQAIELLTVQERLFGNWWSASKVPMKPE